MSTRSVAKGAAIEYGKDRANLAVQRQMNEVAKRTAAIPLAAGNFIAGEYDATQPGKLTDGISFTAGQTKDIPHYLGREPMGFVVVDAQGNAAYLVRLPQTDAQLKKTHIRLQENAGLAFRVKLVVF